ncbi:MAG: EAL domain-containing protein [Marinobacter sp.]|uniref:EAL domain-containing protein n=1 Tax=Marinobacter sp. TaxID=50741 RepID=UPI00299CDED4|nr:EAL domain-containing protein [Marinobacter sp.]MDX1635164.1 EAL domain-containing protein [Marinobacter sp.]
MTDFVKNIHVLVVDDDHDDTFLMQRHLGQMQRFNAQVTHESDLDSAIERCSQTSYDAVFVDYWWGDQTADQLIGNLPADLKTLPFIVVTVSDDFSVNEAVIRSGAWDFICKSDLNAKLLERTLLHAVQRRDHERELYRLIRQDSLTGLANRTMFEEQLKRAIAQAERHGTRCAVIALDLDDFKQINDSLGHDTGDMLLQLLADRLQRELRDGDTLARLGGDEFALLVEDFDSDEQLQTIANKLAATLGAPTPIRGITSRVTGSFGIAKFPDNASSPLEMMRYADIALYAAKDSGRDCIAFFDSQLEAELIEGLSLEQDIRRALGQNEFVPFFQPQYNAAKREIVGVEVLARWQHPKEGLLLPASFIPVAERSNLMLELDRAMIRRTLELLAEAGAIPKNDKAYTLSFNITAAQLLDRNFAGEMLDLCGRAGVSPRYLQFEIVERVLIDRSAHETLQKLRDAGFGLSVDDFGTGFSSMSYLKNLPVTAIKIDRSFVEKLGQETASAGICEAIACIGRRLELTVIGEGVETEEQLKILRDFGVDAVQGYLLGRPMPLKQWLKQIPNHTGREVGHGST